MRTFIAIEVPTDMKDDLAAVARTLQGSAKGRFVSRENYHMTLAFLGDIPQAMLASAQDAMDHAINRTGCLDGIDLKADRLGIFGRKRNATLWMGFAKDPKLMELAAHLRDQLDRNGFALDGKSFLPHVTLARHARLPHGHLPNILFPETKKAEQLTLFRSKLHPDGAVYEPLYSIPLLGSSEVYDMKYPTDNPESIRLISDVGRYIDEVFIDEAFIDEAFKGTACDVLFKDSALENHETIPKAPASPSFQTAEDESLYRTPSKSGTTENENFSKPPSRALSGSEPEPLLAQTDSAEITGSFAPISADAGIAAPQIAPRTASHQQVVTPTLQSEPHPQATAYPQDTALLQAPSCPQAATLPQATSYPQATMLPQAEAPLDLTERLENLDESFARTVLRLIDESGMDDVDVYKRANMSRQLFAKIRKDDNYRPTKKTACALAFALKLSHDDALALLSRAGFALSHSSKFDVIIEYFLINHIHDIHQINMTLYAFDQQILG